MTHHIRENHVNSNKASMSFELCAFQDGIKSGWEDIFETSISSGKSVMIRSNSTNLQIFDKTRVLRAWSTYKPK